MIAISICGMVNQKLAKQAQQETERDEQSERRAKKKERSTQIFCDLCGLLGLASLGYGIYQIHPPSMFIVCGTLVLIGATLAARN